MPHGHRLARIAAEAATAPTPSAALRKVSELRRELDAFEQWQVTQALAEGGSFAAIARDLGLSRQAVHRRYRRLSGFQAVTAPEVRRILRYARQEARSMGTDELRSEHLLLAVMRAAELPAARVLRTAGLTIEGVRSQVGRQSSRRRRYGRESPDTEELHRLVAAKVDEATGRRGQQIEVEDLLFAALSEPESGASQTVRELGGDPHEIARGLIALLTPEAGRGAPHDTPTATN